MTDNLLWTTCAWFYTKVQIENNFRAKKVLIKHVLILTLRWIACLMSRINEENVWKQDLNHTWLKQVSLFLQLLATNLRPFLETISSSLLSTPLSHRSCPACFPFKWVSFVRANPFRQSRNGGCFPVLDAPLKTLQMFSVFNRPGNLKRNLWS